MGPVQVYPEATKSIPAPLPAGQMKQEVHHGHAAPAFGAPPMMGHPQHPGATAGYAGQIPGYPQAQGGPPRMPPNMPPTGPYGQPAPQAVQPSFGPPLYPAHNELASLEMGPGFGPNQGDTKMASLPPPPQSEAELKDIIKKRCKLEMVHPYEKLLIESYDGNSKSVPNIQPTPEYLRLVRDRAILKVQLLRAQERGFDVYGTAAQIYNHSGASNTDPYGFSSNPGASISSNGAPKMEANGSNGGAGGPASNAGPGPTASGPGPAVPGNRADDYAVAYGNNQAAGGPIMLRKEYVPRRTPY